MTHELVNALLFIVIAVLSWHLQKRAKQVAGENERLRAEVAELRGLAAPIRTAALLDDWHEFDALIAALGGGEAGDAD